MPKYQIYLSMFGRDCAWDSWGVYHPSRHWKRSQKKIRRMRRQGCKI